MSYTTKDYMWPVRFENLEWLESYKKEYEENYRKSLEKQKYDEIWKKIKKKNN